MIKTTSEQPAYRTSFTNGQHVALSDATRDKGGNDSGFRPHELLEAALASCMNIWLRIFAEKHAIALVSVSTTVTLDRSKPDEVIFNYSLDLSGSLSESDRERLANAVHACPVKQTLSKKISFSG